MLEKITSSSHQGWRLPKYPTTKLAVTTLIMCLSTGLAACAPHPASQLDCGSSSQLVVPSSPELQREFAREIASRAKEVRMRVERSPSATGFTGSILGRIGGTSAYGIGVEIKGLRELIARQVAREQALHNSGQVLVPMEQSWACELLADSVESLDPGQSKESLVEALENVERLYEAASHKKGNRN